MTIGDNRDYIRVLLYSHYTTITGWGVRFCFFGVGEFELGQRRDV